MQEEPIGKLEIVQADDIINLKKEIIHAKSIDFRRQLFYRQTDYRTVFGRRLGGFVTKPRQ